LRQFIETQKQIITMNRVILVNTFLNLTWLQFSISSEQLLLGTPPLRNHSSAKIPNSIHSGIKLDLKKLVFVVFFGILPLNVKSNISSDFGFWCSEPPFSKMTKIRETHTSVCQTFNSSIQNLLNVLILIRSLYSSCTSRW
jgi:hypothetical protein